ncbi:hypothetical protein DFH07DRAFT_1054901 [Mycena maculata]|uniref:Uncharacterized protein n=1 Tax=Mycena maculata TaxID=230809 RepID=A0AAD7KFP9_9AGAR|nr:hypothetical protein DFH07DRAFT_1054901 [Mycena maculata]
MSFAALFVLWSALPWLVTSTFSFTSTTPTQCDDLEISWTGGSGSGYYLSILPVFDVLRNISIPSTAFSNGKGIFSTTMPFNETDRIALTMSDSSGFGAGGSTTLLTVGKSLGGSCNTSSPGVAFSFALNEALQQCQPYEFSDYIETGAVAPVTIYGVIPGGDSFVLNPPNGPKTFDWTADVFNGTQIIFSMVDANLRQGGSFLNTVAISGDSSCINSTSPSSTINPSASSTSSASSSASSTSSNGGSTSTGAIAGSVLGALLFLAVLVTLGLFFLRQRQERKRARLAGVSEFRRSSRPMDSELDVSNIHPFIPPSNSVTPTSSLFQGQDHLSLSGSSRPPAHYQPHSEYLSSRIPQHENPFAGTSHDADIDPFMEQTVSDTVSGGRRKSGMSAYTNYTASRFVLHTDAEDIPPNEEGVVELPPQYSATRPPAKLPPSDSFYSAPPL